MSQKRTRSYVIDEETDGEIMQKAHQLGDVSDSAALRVIVREWRNFKDQEYAKLYSQPNPLITVEDAVKAADAVAGGGI